MIMENNIELIQDLMDIDLLTLTCGKDLHKKQIDNLNCDRKKILWKLQRNNFLSNEFCNPQDVINKMTLVFNAPAGYATAKTRKKEYVHYRQITIVICKELFPKLSLKEIGSYFFKDHATVLHSRKRANNLYDTERKYREEFDRIQFYFLNHTEIFNKN
jgi:chromosomal replication initiation ATPase DnaA